MSFYKDWGFSDTPFMASPLPSSSLGAELLVGRSSELKRLVSRLDNPPKMLTLEGVNGVGKTSLVNVAIFKSLQEHMKTGRGPLLMPCNERFQLIPDDSIDGLLDKVYIAVANTLVERISDLEAMVRAMPSTALVERWLNAPERRSIQNNIDTFRRLSAFNPSFERNVFRFQVRDWLGRIFQTSADGGIVCILDNTELLRLSLAARHLMENLRDLLLQELPGTRWVLCGSHGIAHGISMIRRFDGYIHDPIRVGDVDSEAALSILTTRVSAFSMPGKKAYLPFSGVEFAMLHKILGADLRSLLSSIDDYCLWVHEQYPLIRPVNYKNLFQSWIREKSLSHYREASSRISPNAWHVFENISRDRGEIKLHDFNDSDVNKRAAIQRSVRELSDAGLLSGGELNSKDEIRYITSMGRLVNFARRHKLG